MTGTYTHQGHGRRVKQASASRNGTRQVLSEMCSEASFKKPEVKISKPQLVELTGLSINTVKAALRFLKSEGSIVQVLGGKGGHGVAPTYQLVIIQGDNSEPPQQAPQGNPDAVRKSKAYMDRISELMRDNGVGYGEARSMADKEFNL